MESRSSLGTGFSVRAVAGGAAVRIDLRDPFLHYDVTDELKEHLRRAVGEQLLAGYRAFVLDVARVELIDSCGVGLLIGVHHQIADAGGLLAVTGTCPFVTKVLKAMRLDRFLALYPDPEKALRALVDPV